MIEIWKTVLDAPRYQVSSEGRVRSTPQVRGGGRLLKPGLSTRYLKVTLALGGGVNKDRKVHDLVLTAFAGERPFGAVARHKDDDPLNNRASNLCWGTQKENLADRTANGNTLSGETHPHAILSWEAVAEIREVPRYAKGKMTALALKYGVSTDAINDVRLGRSWVADLTKIK
jgi:hypothetical protein